MSGVMHVTEFFIICWKAMPIAFYPPLNFRNQEKKNMFQISIRYSFNVFSCRFSEITRKTVFSMLQIIIYKDIHIHKHL